MSPIDIAAYIDKTNSNVKFQTGLATVVLAVDSGILGIIATNFQSIPLAMCCGSFIACITCIIAGLITGHVKERPKSPLMFTAGTLNNHICLYAAAFSMPTSLCVMGLSLSLIAFFLGSGDPPTSPWASLIVYIHPIPTPVLQLGRFGLQLGNITCPSFIGMQLLQDYEETNKTTIVQIPGACTAPHQTSMACRSAIPGVTPGASRTLLEVPGTQHRRKCSQSVAGPDRLAAEAHSRQHSHSVTTPYQQLHQNNQLTGRQSRLWTPGPSHSTSHTPSIIRPALPSHPIIPSSRALSVAPTNPIPRVLGRQTKSPAILDRVDGQSNGRQHVPSFSVHSPELHGDEMSIVMEEDHRSQLANSSQLVIEQLSDFDGPSEFLTELEDLEYERSYPGLEANSRYFGRNEEDEFALGWPEDQMEVNDTGIDHHDKPWSPPPLDSKDEAGFGDEELQHEHECLWGTTPPNSNLTHLQEAFGGIQHTEVDINMSIDEAFDIDLNFGPPEDNGVDFKALASHSSSVQPRVQKQTVPCLPSEEYLDDVRHQQKAGPTKEPPHNDQGDTAGYDEDRGVIHNGPVDHDEEADKQAGDEASRKSKNKRKARVLKENHGNPSLIGYYPTLCTAMLKMAKGYFRQHVMLVDPFPARLEALSTTCDKMVAEALTMFMTLNRKIEDGTSAS
ncbi:hypothetical protein PAXINDRAFT_15844 [Paxillus involutus ATCC 200175]|uniref:Uncharacterized protein n=1 Tax=Paxillus involutus ATCC 200175 TaxID=664439 RepID=A0A0C9TKN8_PAXIN|nr:hypothetical protein PAXINDRAFT_15844 [Paxillus involutus ATCC 200175]